MEKQLDEVLVNEGIIMIKKNLCRSNSGVE